MLFAGSRVAAGDLTCSVFAGGLLVHPRGSWIAYAVGYYGRIDLLTRTSSSTQPNT